MLGSGTLPASRCAACVTVLVIALVLATAANAEDLAAVWLGGTSPVLWWHGTGVWSTPYYPGHPDQPGPYDVVLDSRASGYPVWIGTLPDVPALLINSLRIDAAQAMVKQLSGHLLASSIEVHSGVYEIFDGSVGANSLWLKGPEAVFRQYGGQVAASLMDIEAGRFEFLAGTISGARVQSGPLGRMEVAATPFRPHNLSEPHALFENVTLACDLLVHDRKGFLARGLFTLDSATVVLGGEMAIQGDNAALTGSGLIDFRGGTIRAYMDDPMADRTDLIPISPDIHLYVGDGHSGTLTGGRYLITGQVTVEGQGQRTGLSMRGRNEGRIDVARAALSLWDMENAGTIRIEAGELKAWHWNGPLGDLQIAGPATVSLHGNYVFDRPLVLGPGSSLTLWNTWDNQAGITVLDGTVSLNPLVSIVLADAEGYDFTGSDLMVTEIHNTGHDLRIGRLGEKSLTLNHSNGAITRGRISQWPGSEATLVLSPPEAKPGTSRPVIRGVELAMDARLHGECTVMLGLTLDDARITGSGKLLFSGFQDLDGKGEIDARVNVLGSLTVGPEIKLRRGVELSRSALLVNQGHITGAITYTSGVGPFGMVRNEGLIELPSGPTTYRQVDGTLGHIVMPSGAHFTVQNGAYSVDKPLNVLGQGRLNLGGTWSADASMTFDSGSIADLSGTSTLRNIINMAEGGQLTLRGQVANLGTVRLATDGQLTLRGEVSNLGALELASGGLLTFDGKVTNHGVIRAVDGTVWIHDTLSLAPESVFDVAGSTVHLRGVLDMQGSPLPSAEAWALQNATLRNAVVGPGSGSVTITSGLALDTVTLVTDLSIQGATIRDLTLQDATMRLLHTNAVTFPGDQSLDGSGVLLMDGTSSQPRRLVVSDGTLTLGPDIHIQVNRRLDIQGSGQAHVVNHGVIGGQATLRLLSLESFHNFGTLTFDNTQFTVNRTFINDGVVIGNNSVFSLEQGASLDVVSGFQMTDSRVHSTNLAFDNTGKELSLGGQNTEWRFLQASSISGGLLRAESGSWVTASGQLTLDNVIVDTDVIVREGSWLINNRRHYNHLAMVNGSRLVGGRTVRLQGANLLIDDLEGQGEVLFDATSSLTGEIRPAPGRTHYTIGEGIAIRTDGRSGHLRFTDTDLTLRGMVSASNSIWITSSAFRNEGLLEVYGSGMLSITGMAGPLGSVAMDGGTIYVNGTYTVDDPLNIGHGHMEFRGDWTNLSTISMDQGRLALQTAPTEWGTIQTTGGRVDLRGTVPWEGLRTLTAQDTTLHVLSEGLLTSEGPIDLAARGWGALVLQGGRVQSAGAPIRAVSVQALTGQSTVIGATMESDLSIARGARLTLEGGCVTGDIQLAGTLTLTGTGTLAGLIQSNEGLLDFGAGWTNAGQIRTVDTAVRLRGSLESLGDSQFDGGRVSLEAAYTTPEAISIAEALGSVHVGAEGTVDNRGYDLHLGAEGPSLILSGGMLWGGRITDATNLDLQWLAPNNPNIIRGVTLATDLAVPHGFSSLLSVAEGMTLDGGRLIIRSFYGTPATVQLDRSCARIAGEGEIVFDNQWPTGAAGSIQYQGLDPLDMVIESGVVVRTGNASGIMQVPASNRQGVVINEGTLRAETDKRTLTVQNVRFVNRGLIHARSGGTVVFSHGMLANEGEMRVDARSTILLGTASWWAPAMAVPSLTLELGAGESILYSYGPLMDLGTLALTLESGYMPSIGQAFQIISAASLQGQFSHVDLTGLPDWLDVELRYEGHRLLVDVVAIPEPTTLAMLVMGMLGICRRQSW